MANTNIMKDTEDRPPDDRPAAQTAVNYNRDSIINAFQIAKSKSQGAQTLVISNINSTIETSRMLP